MWNFKNHGYFSYYAWNFEIHSVLRLVRLRNYCSASPRLFFWLLSSPLVQHAQINKSSCSSQKKETFINSEDAASYWISITIKTLETGIKREPLFLNVERFIASLSQQLESIPAWPKIIDQFLIYSSLRKKPDGFFFFFFYPSHEKFSSYLGPLLVILLSDLFLLLVVLDSVPQCHGSGTQ